MIKVAAIPPQLAPILALALHRRPRPRPPPAHAHAHPVPLPFTPHHGRCSLLSLQPLHCSARTRGSASGAVGPSRCAAWRCECCEARMMRRRPHAQVVLRGAGLVRRGPRSRGASAIWGSLPLGLALRLARAISHDTLTLLSIERRYLGAWVSRSRAALAPRG